MYKKKTPFLIWEGVINQHLYCGFRKLLRQTGLFTICCILMDNTLCSSLVNRGGGLIQLSTSIGGIGSNGGAELLERSAHSVFHHTILQGLLGADFNAFLSGLDIRQLFHLPNQLDEKIIARNLSMKVQKLQAFFQK